jgi:hypothetical protein
MAGVRDTTLGDSLSVTRDTVQWFSPGTPVSSTNKTGRHDSENWPRTSNIRKLAQDHKGYGSAARVFSTTFNIILATS